ncbi:hypothetical protein BB934_00595 [Microvirga ossetica]|uniref:Uncharacterized protein n=1 Tax=Microvirga ossetica TaxID=1882682 RepID=A0A1B2EAE2_9HYPH|nr:hypothetical protein [Microvirga ossetica]ANY76899.1 hypothetical protein BB934_00595 [Microvirga ossetica]
MECSDETIKIWPTQVAPAGYFEVGSPYIGRSSRSIVRKTSDLGAEAAKFSALNSLKNLENLTIFIVIRLQSSLNAMMSARKSLWKVKSADDHSVAGQTIKASLAKLQGFLAWNGFGIARRGFTMPKRD